MSISKKTRQLVYDKLGGKCGYCGESLTMKTMQVDHIIPKEWFNEMLKKQKHVPYFLTHLKDGELNHIDNLMPSCRVCNKWKTSFDLEYFRNEIAMQVSRLNKYSSNYRMAKKYGLIKETEQPIIFYFEKIKQP